MGPVEAREGSGGPIKYPSRHLFNGLSALGFSHPGCRELLFAPSPTFFHLCQVVLAAVSLALCHSQPFSSLSVLGNELHSSLDNQHHHPHYKETQTVPVAVKYRQGNVHRADLGQPLRPANVLCSCSSSLTVLSG